MQLRFRSFNRHVLAVFAVVALAACGSNTAVPQVDPKLTITSAGESATRDYYLTGTAVLPAGTSASLQYRLDGGDWQTVPIGRDSTFSAVITLDEGSNLIQVALTAGETRVERELTVNVNVSGTPVVIFTSDTFTKSRAYRLSGLAFDDFGVEQLEYRLNSERPVELPLSGNEFEAALTLATGMNTIAVTATDGAGNAGTATLTVTFEPQIENARADPMVAQHSTTVTLTGNNFGTQPGTVHFGNHVTATGTVQLAGDGGLDVTDNVFEFTGGDHSVAAIAMNAPAAAGATQVEFLDNLVSGRNRLFAFNGGAGDLGVNMTGNTFNAELRTVGDVATLTNVVAPSLITTSDNRWGDLESAAAVLELIELTASDAYRMTVAEF